MFRDIPRIVRCLVSMPTLFWATITDATRKPGETAADRRVSQDPGPYFADDPWVD